MNYSLGLEDLVAKNLNEYKAKTRNLISDKKLYEKYKEIIRINRNKLPLFNTEMLARNFEKALFKMYRNWIDGNSPRTIVIS
jgi:predicted O-linked N-acetylglucosamine transferase (SPINDLY family)